MTPLPPVGSDPGGLLVPAGSPDGFNTYMVNSLEVWGGLSKDSGELRTALVSDPFPTTSDPVVTTDLDAAPEAFSSDASRNVTGTNVLVSGVDEIDAVKFNGDHVFLANNQSLTSIQVNPDGTSSVVSNIQLLNEDYSGYQGIYLRETASQDVIAAIRGGGQVFLAADALFAPWFFDNNAHVDFVDVTQPDAPQPTGFVEIDGNLIQSRLVDGTLYLVSQFTPRVDGYIPFASDERTQAENKRLLAETKTTAFIPQVRTGAGEGTPLIDPADCLIPNPDRDLKADSYPTLTSVTAIDVDTRQVTATACFAEGVWGVHMTPSTLYVAGPSHEGETAFYDATTVHKFSLGSASIDYRGSGTVQGTFWGDPAFLMGEHDGYLTMITTESLTGRNFSHRLTLLGEGSDNDLEIAGSIPNDNRPEAIGKPGEQIFAARILGDRAYVVTFERVDPVYAIDLSNPSDPMIQGELEIPGFSSYLHPLSDELLLGIGSDTSEVDGRVTIGGLNVRLFDVSNPQQISLLSETSIGRQGTFSEVFWDYHAFTVQSLGDDRWRAAIPVHRYGAHVPDEGETDFRGYPWTDTALQLFDVSADGLSSAGQITGEDHDSGQRFYSGCCNWQDRSFISDDTVYYLNKNVLAGADWQQPDLTSKTFIPTAWLVDADRCANFKQQDPISVSLFDRESSAYLSCGYSIQESESDDPSLVACEDPIVETDRPVEAAGSYSVSVELQGYQRQTVNDVVVQTDACGLSTTYLNLYLVPE